MNAKQWADKFANQEAARKGTAPPPRPNTLKALQTLLATLSDIKEFVDAAIKGDLSALDEVISEFSHPQNVFTRACGGVCDAAQEDDDDEATAAAEAEEEETRAAEAMLREEAAYRAEKN